MALTVFDLLLQTARNLEAVVESLTTAVGTGNNTLVDAKLSDANYGAGWETDDFAGGTAFWVRRAAGGNPQNLRVITDYDAPTNKVTVDQSWDFSGAANTGSGDGYALLQKQYPRDLVVGKLNQVLLDAGDAPVEDTTVTTAADQKEYSYAGDYTNRILEVWLAHQLAAPWEWERVAGVRARLSGSTTLLEFPYQPRVGYKIKLLVLTRPSPVSLAPAGNESANTLSPHLNADWLALETAVRCVRWRLQQPDAREDKLTALLNDLLNRAANAKRRRGVPSPNPQPIFPHTEID